MSESIIETTHRHGREMYIIGLEHAISMIEVLGDDARANLIAKVEREKSELEDAYHNRFDENHRKTCEDCQDAYDDFCQEQDSEKQPDEK